MLNMKFRIKLYTIIFILLLIASGCGKKSDEDIVVAEVGDYKISLAAFARSYLNVIKSTPVNVQDSPELRRQHLDDMITRHFLALRAQENNIMNMPGFKRVMKAESTATIITGLYEQEIVANLGEVTEEELQAAYVKMNMNLHVRHLIARTKAGIDSLYQRIQQGATFNELARECFRDSSLKYSGGDLGIISWGDTDIDFENAAYQLRVGEISKPVETKYRWHIIKLENVIINPIIREDEFNVRKKGIEQRLQHRMLKNRADFRIKELMTEKDVTMNVPLIIEIEKMWRQRNDNNPLQINQNEEIPRANFYANVLEKFQNETIATFEEGHWSVKDFFDNLYTIRSDYFEAGIYRAVAMALRNHFLLKEAREKRIDRVKSVRNRINEKREHLASASYVQFYSDTCTFTNDDYRYYYNSIKKMYYNDKQMRVLEILVKTQQQASGIIDELKAANSTESTFRELARQFTIRPGMKDNEGDLGIISSRDYGEIGKYAAMLNNGGLAGPIKTPAGYSVIMLHDYEDNFTPFEQVKGDMEKAVNDRKKSFVFEKMRRKYSGQPDVVIHEDVLLNGF